MFFMNHTVRSYFLSLTEFVTACREYGAYGMTISGAGPSLFVAVKQGDEKEVAERLALRFPYYECIAVQPSITGAIIIKKK